MTSCNYEFQLSSQLPCYSIVHVVFTCTWTLNKHDWIRRRPLDFGAGREYFFEVKSLISLLHRKTGQMFCMQEFLHEKVHQLHTTVNQILDRNCPARKVEVREDQPPGIAETIRKAIRARDRA